MMDAQRQTTSAIQWGLVILVVGNLAACGGGKKPRAEADAAEDAPANVAERRAYAAKKGWTLKEFDLNRDGEPDIFKYFIPAEPGAAEGATGPLVRKEVDLNHDTRVDVVRIYNQDESLSEERYDLDFDGRMDAVAHFEKGSLSRKEIDVNYDGKPDVFRFYLGGKISRIESDRSGDGRVDTWEYYEGGELDRIGVDRDGDGKVDDWERRGQDGAEEASGEASEGGEPEEAPAEGDAPEGAESAEPERDSAAPAEEVAPPPPDGEVPAQAPTNAKEDGAQPPAETTTEE